jgi:4,5-DOPA dioxygenase extradiol
MTRKDFLKLSALFMASPFYANMSLSEIKIMPVLFVGHGSPMNIIRDNTFTKSLKNITKKFEKPKVEW